MWLRTTTARGYIMVIQAGRPMIGRLMVGPAVRVILLQEGVEGGDSTVNTAPALVSEALLEEDQMQLQMHSEFWDNFIATAAAASIDCGRTQAGRNLTYSSIQVGTRGPRGMGWSSWMPNCKLAWVGRRARIRAEKPWSKRNVLLTISRLNAFMDLHTSN